jgi:predicted KAP-like P-loop ATPase
MEVLPMHKIEIDSDEPLKGPSEDNLGYAAFAAHLARCIPKTPKEGSILGIYGPWGSGKTSMLNLIQHYLVKEPKDLQPCIVHFNPWWFSGQKDLIIRFFIAIREVLKKTDKNNLADMFLDFADLVSDINAPWGVRLVYRLISKFKKRSVEKYGLIDRKRDMIIEALLKRNRKILVIIDDMDRLTTDEIQQIFKLIKSVANFPNIVYLLAFDERLVSLALEKNHIITGSGREYLKKIVQVPFELPRLAKSSLGNSLEKRLSKLFSTSSQEKYFNDIRWDSIFYNGILSFIETPRDVIRLINTLHVTYACVKGDVNSVDFVAIEALRIFTPDVYHMIRLNSNLFTGSERQNIVWDEIIPKDMKSKGKIAIKSILITLFPKLDANLKFSADFLIHGEKNLLIYCPKYFSRFFRLAI